MNEIQKFASDACAVIEACQEVIGQLSTENKKLRLAKQASAASPFNAETLQKAASAVYSLHGSPTNCTADDIADYWTANPNSLLSTINKLASDRLAVAESNQDMGKIISKKASAETSKTDSAKADDIFWQNI